MRYYCDLLCIFYATYLREIDPLRNPQAGMRPLAMNVTNATCYELVEIS